MTSEASSAPAWERRSVQAGEWRITAISDGFFRLDGGSMWGVVPANIWRKLTPAAEDNTILLALRPFLLEVDHLGLAHPPALDREPDARLDLVEPLPPRGAARPIESTV